jgi:integrase/recombinase XerD
VIALRTATEMALVPASSPASAADFWDLLTASLDACASTKEANMTPLRQRMIDELVRRNYGARTIKTYVGNMVAIARHFKKSPDKLTADEVRAWQLGLREQGLSFSTYNTHSCALRFFFRYVDPRGEDLTTLVPFARRERKLPAILSQAEVRALLAAITDGRDRVMVTIAYACGLRVSELASLRVTDIDGARKLIHVHAGKGRKDRLVPLSDSLLTLLRDYYRVYRPKEWLFVGERGGHVVDRTVQRAVREAAVAARIRKKVTPHTLRHCFATHMLEAGVDIRTVQSMLGHTSIGTTIRYHHVARQVVTAMKSPLDILDPST